MVSTVFGFDANVRIVRISSIRTPWLLTFIENSHNIESPRARIIMVLSRRFKDGVTKNGFIFHKNDFKVVESDNQT